MRWVFLLMLGCGDVSSRYYPAAMEICGSESVEGRAQFVLDCALNQSLLERGVGEDLVAQCYRVSTSLFCTPVAHACSLIGGRLIPDCVPCTMAPIGSRYEEQCRK